MKIQLKTEPQMTDIEIGGNDIAFCWSDERTGLTVVELSDAGADHLVRRNVSFLNLSPEMAALGSTLSHVDYRLDDNQICFAATKVETLRRQTPRRVRAPPAPAKKCARALCSTATERWLRYSQAATTTGPLPQPQRLLPYPHGRHVQYASGRILRGARTLSEFLV